MSEAYTLDKKKYLRSADDILKFAGEFGPYQWILDGIFFLMILTTSSHPVMMVFTAINPSWQCTSNATRCFFNKTMPSDDFRRCNMPRSDWEYSEKDSFSIAAQFDLSCSRSWMNYLASSVFFLGWGVGAIFLGSLADNYGRKTVLMPSFFGIIIVTVSSVLSPNMYIFAFTRFMVGFLLPGVWIQAFILISELVGKKQRAVAGQMMKIGHTTGYSLLALIAYYVRDWKLIMILSNAPYLTVLLFYKVIPESLIWLRLRGKSEAASNNFRLMAKWNKKEIPNDVELGPPLVVSNEKVSVVGIFQTRAMMISTLAQGYGWLTCGIVYYGLLLAAKDLGGSLYLDFVILSLADLPAVPLSIFFLDYLGRKKTIISAMVVGGVCSMGIGFVPLHGSVQLIRVVLGSIGKCFINISFNSQYTWSSELYPTNLRSMGLGFMQLAAHIGAAGAPWVAEGLKSVSESAPFIAMGVAVISGSFVSLLLPETREKELSD